MSGSPPRGALLGYGEALAAACLWGSSGIFAVNLFRLGVPPETVALVRPLIGVAFLVGGIALTKPGLLAIDARGLLFLALGGGAAMGVFQIAYQLSIDAAGVPTTVALLYIAPAIVAAVSGPLLGEWPGRSRVALIAVTLAGVWLTVLGAEDVETTFGRPSLAWGALAGAAYAAYTLLGRYATPRFGSARTVVYSTGGACVFLLLTLPWFTGALTLPAAWRAWLLLIVFGLLTIAVATFLFFDALGRIEASGASVVTAAEPAVAALLATLLLSQRLSPVGWIGIGLVVAGVVGVGMTARSEPSGR